MTVQGKRARGGARTLALIVLFALASAFASPAAAEDVGRLIERVMNAYGGHARLAAVGRLHATGTTSSLRTGTNGPSERWFARPDKLRIDLRYSPTHAESRILNGAQSWKDGAPVNEPFRTAMVLQAARFRLPLILAERPVSDRGEANESGRTMRLLSVDVGGGLSLEVAIDPASARIERSRGVVSFGGQTMEFATAYGDFRTVDGVLFAHREAHFAMGMRTGETVLSRIEVNPRFATEVFRP
jgi:hypothetical protein